MTPTGGNLFSPLPGAGADESFSTLLAAPGVRIERIVSHGHASPPGFWYDQAEDEWVCLLEGEATLAIEGAPARRLGRGDWLLIPAGCRHRVLATSSPAVWLAVFVGGSAEPADG